MSNAAKRHGTPRKNRRILVSAVAVFLVLISVLAYVSSLHQPSTNNNTVTKAPSSTYFAISNLGGIYEVRSFAEAVTPGPTIKLKEFIFNFTPVGGDAHDVIIFTQGGNFDPTAGGTDWEGKTFKNGTSIYTGEVQLPDAVGVPYDKATGTWIWKVRIESREADGWVQLNFTEDVLSPIVVPVS